jgi:ornithine carbamoyltransferase
MAKKTPEQMEAEAKKLLENARKLKEQRYTEFGKEVKKALDDGKDLAFIIEKAKEIFA